MSDFRLKVFHTAAKNLSFTKAATELCISQPAVTKHIHELEREYDIRLFVRLGNKILLTEAGKLVLKHAETILADYRNLEYEIHRFNDKHSGELRLGASTTIAQYVLPQILAGFSAKYPDIRISLSDSNSSNIEKALESGEIDLGLIEGIARNSSLKYLPFIDDELVAVTRTGFLPETDEISLSEFCQFPLVLREYGSGTLDIITEELAKRGLRLSDLNVRMHIGSTEGIKSYLRCSNTMGILSVYSFRRELKERTLKIVDIIDLQIRRQFCFAFNHGQLSPSATQFLRFATKVASKNLL